MEYHQHHHIINASQAFHVRELARETRAPTTIPRARVGSLAGIPSTQVPVGPHRPEPRPPAGLPIPPTTIGIPRRTIKNAAGIPRRQTRNSMSQPTPTGLRNHIQTTPVDRTNRHGNPIVTRRFRGHQMELEFRFQTPEQAAGMSPSDTIAAHCLSYDDTN